MIPFDLELAKKGRPLVTRNGKRAHFIAMLDRKIPAPLLVDVEGINENYYINGRFETVHEHALDLFMLDTLISDDHSEDRKNGFYWVVLDKSWVIAEWDGDEECWFLTNTEDTFEDEDFDEIDEESIKR